MVSAGFFGDNVAVDAVVVNVESVVGVTGFDHWQSQKTKEKAKKVRLKVETNSKRASTIAYSEL